MKRFLVTASIILLSFNSISQDRAIDSLQALASLYLRKGVLDSVENAGMRALQHARDFKLANLEMHIYSTFRY